MQIKIEKDVPLVKKRSGGAAAEAGIIAALEALQVGESFAVPNALRNLVTGGVSTLKQKDKQKQYMTRTIGETVRCWRVAVPQVEPTIQLEADLRPPSFDTDQVKTMIQQVLEEYISKAERK